ncbi:unnamed protein product [Calicophoron daubneyi]|uniref:Rotatin N-terminal domain-containing protein n=1 Tax=Calicophoron daubneyi TaxID=300641 RepID=A0AAV2TNI3_CALDB
MVKEGEGCSVLIDKLDHPIDEIRCRTLSNIYSKLQRGLLPLYALNSPILANKLLDWLNQRPLLNTRSALEVLKAVARGDNGKLNIIYAGGLVILNRLKKQLCSDELSKLVDEIFNIISDGAHEPNCKVSGDLMLPDPGTATVTKKSRMTGNSNRMAKFSVSSGLNANGRMNSNQGNENDTEDITMPSKTSTSRREPRTRRIFKRFPSVPLTKTDVDVLNASLNSIMSTDLETSIAGISFFRDVVLEDFPAEVFIQRWIFIENLLKHVLGENQQKAYYAVTALIALCQKLGTRVYHQLDPNNQNSFYDFLSAHPADATGNGGVSSDPLPTTDERVSGSLQSSHVQSETGVGAEQPEASDRYSQELCQLSLPEVCCNLLKTVGSRLDSSTFSQFQKQSQPNEKHPSTCHSLSYCVNNLESKLLQLTCALVDLLLISLSPDIAGKQTCRNPSQIPNSTFVFTNWMMLRVPPRTDAVNSQDLPISFTSALEPWGRFLAKLSSNWLHKTHTSNSMSWDSSELAKLVCEAAMPLEKERNLYIGTLSALFQLISSLFTPETALRVLPTDLRNQMSMALLDFGLLCRPFHIETDVCEYGLPAYVMMFNSAIYSAWRLLIQLESSMWGLTKFLSEIESFGGKSVEDKNLSALIHAVNGMDVLGVVGSTHFASEAVRFLNEPSYSLKSLTSKELWRGQLVLLRLLGNQLLPARKAAYSELVRIVEHALDPDVVADPTQEPNRFDFLLSDEVLCECIEYGMRDEDIDVRTSAERLLACLLDSHELIVKTSWKTLYRLMLEPNAAGQNSSTISPRPLVISLGPFADVIKSEGSPSPLSRVALNWCSGCMGPEGWVDPKQLDGSVDTVYKSIEMNSYPQIFYSCCRLLMHPKERVRSYIAPVVWRHLEHFWSRCLDATSDPASKHHTTVQELLDARTSEKENFELKLIECIKESMTDGDTLSGSHRPSLLEHPDLMESDGVTLAVPEELESLRNVIQLFMDTEADLTVRKAAGEQIAILIKNPSMLDAWYAANGVADSCDLVLEIGRALMNSTERNSTVEPSASSDQVNVSKAILLPVLIRMLRFSSVWNANIRQELAKNLDLVFTLLYVRIMIPDSHGFHRDLVDLMALLLFSSVIQVGVETPVCLPEGVVSGYALPFDCPTYSYRTQWSKENGDPFQPILDIIQTPPTDENSLALSNLVGRSLRYSWNFTCHCGISAFTRNSLALIDALPEQVSVDPVQVDRCMTRCRGYTPYQSQVSLSSEDMSLLLFSYPEASFMLCFTSIRKASNPTVLYRALAALHRATWAHHWQAFSNPLWKTKICDESNEDSSPQYWWIHAQLSRFLTTLPACSSDFTLLTTLLETVENIGLLYSSAILAQFGSQNKLCTWLMNRIADSHGTLGHYLLQGGAGIGETDSHRLTSAKRLLSYQQLPHLLYSLAGCMDASELASELYKASGSSVASSYTSLSATSTGVRNLNKWHGFMEKCYQWAYTNLIEFIESPFSDLVRLRLTIGVLSSFTSPNLWSSMSNSIWLWRLIDAVTTLLALFDAGRDEANASFMGVGTLQLLLNLVSHLIYHVSSLKSNPATTRPEPTNEKWISLPPDVPPTPEAHVSWVENDWLLRCLVYRQGEVRALALCILGRICLIPVWAKAFTSHQMTTDTSTLLAAHGRNIFANSGKLWSIALIVLLDQSESCLCRAEAAHLLINLTTLPMNPSDSGIFLPPVTEENPAMAELRDTLVTERQRMGYPSARTRASGLNEDGVESLGIPYEPPESGDYTDSASVSQPMPAGDRPTLTSQTGPSEDSDAIDIRDLFNSQLDSSEMRENLVELLAYVRAWFRDSEEFSIGGHGLANEPADEALIQHPSGTVAPNYPLLLHTSAMPEATLLPFCFDATSGLYMLGLPALQHILISGKFIGTISALLSTYYPRLILDSDHLDSTLNSRSSDSTSANKKSLVPTNDTNSANFPHQGTSIHSQGSLSRDFTSDPSASSPSQPTSLCTPLLTSAICQLLTNLMHHFPKWIPVEIGKERINSLLMNIVDPNLIEALIFGSPANAVEPKYRPLGPFSHTGNFCGVGCLNPYLLSVKHLVNAFASCLRVLRCQAAMYETFRLALGSDALFLARLIRSLKDTVAVDFLAPLWCEIFTLLTCLLAHSDGNESVDHSLQLILKPLSTRVSSLVTIVVALINRAEHELDAGLGPNERIAKISCKYARTSAYFLTIVLSQYRPITSNPVVKSLDTIAESGTPNGQVETTKDIGNGLRHSPMSSLIQLLMVLITGSTSVPVERRKKGGRYPMFSYVQAYRQSLYTLMRTLLGVCPSAKSAAVKDGFLEEGIITMQILIAKLDLCSTEAAASLKDNTRSLPVRRRNRGSMDPKLRQWQTFTGELVSLMELIHNLIFNSAEAKQRAVDAGLPKLAQRMWPLALQDIRILHGLLGLLTNLTADCPAAASALACNPSPAKPVLSMPGENVKSRTKSKTKPAPASKENQKNNKLVVFDTPGILAPTHCIVEFVCRLISSSDKSSASSESVFLSRRNSLSQTISAPSSQLSQESTLRYAYQLLANMVWSAEARSSLVKTKLVPHFCEIDARVLWRTRRGQFTILLWLQLIANLSFTKEGQQVLISLPDFTIVLASIIQYSKGYAKEISFLVLRNLCTNGTFKARLLSGDTTVLTCMHDVISDAVTGDISPYFFSTVVSAAEALVQGNQKVHALIKSKGFLRDLTRLWEICRGKPELVEIQPKLQSVMELLQQ